VGWGGWGWGGPGWGWGYAPGYAYYRTPSYYYDTAPYDYSPDNSYYYDEYPAEGYVGDQQGTEPSYSTEEAGGYDEAQGDNSGHVTVRLPSPDATLWFNGARMVAGGTNRTFTTPPLQPGQDYYYKVRVRFLRDGQPVTRTRTLDVRAGQHYTLDFTRPLAGRTGEAVQQEGTNRGVIRDEHRTDVNRNRTDVERNRTDVDRNRTDVERNRKEVERRNQPAEGTNFNRGPNDVRQPRDTERNPAAQPSDLNRPGANRPADTNRPNATNPRSDTNGQSQPNRTPEPDRDNPPRPND
jgi:uncharacterized protein (TIGR03000 family)